MGFSAVVAACALLAGFVFCLPDLLILQHRRFYARHFPDAVAHWPLGGRYTAISPYDDPDANSYAARVNEASRHWLPMDPNVKENESRRLRVTDTLSFMFLGALERLSGDISRAWLLARALCGAGWLAGLYLLLAELSGRKRMALACASALTLFYELLIDPFWPIIASIKMGFHVIPPAFRYMATHAFWLLGNYQANFGASRIISPAINHPPFFLAVFAAWRAAKGDWLWSVAGGVVGGALAYVHPDVWHVYMAAMGLFCALWSGLSRKLVWPLWASFALSFMISLPWITANYPMNPAILDRSGGMATHAPEPMGLVFVLAAAACLIRRQEAGFSFLACVFGACFVAVESQVLTGYTVDPMRFNYLALVVGFIAAAGYLGRRALESRHWLYLTAAVFILGAGRTVSYAAQRYPYQGLPSELDAAFKFLNDKTPSDSVVVSLGPQETMLIPVYTHNKTLVGSGYIVTCDIPSSELFGRIKKASALYRIPEKDLLARLNDPAWVHPQGMDRWMKALWEDRVDWDAREWKNFSHFYMQTIPREEVVQRLKTAPEVRAEADYLWVGPFERELMPKAALAKLGKPLYDGGKIQIYGLN